MITLMLLWGLSLIGCIYTRGNVAMVFVLGYLSALIWAGCFFVNTYDFTLKNPDKNITLKSDFPSEIIEPSNVAKTRT